MSAFNEETVLSVHHWTDRLFTFTTTRDPTLRFSNGHFTMIGLRVNDKPLLRAYSIASANYEEHLEFLSIKVDAGPLTSRLQKIKVGDALAAGTDMGPVSSLAQLEQDLSYVEIARAEGARLVTGGGRVACHTGSGHDGFYMAPTLFADSTSAMRINREEVFGPVASVIQVKDYDEALAVANDTAFGLSAGIATTSLKYATHFKRHSQAGMVMVNLPTAGVDYHVPFGGRKASSYGPREQGRYAQEFFTVVKTAYTLA